MAELHEAQLGMVQQLGICLSIKTLSMQSIFSLSRETNFLDLRKSSMS